ncbi:MAG: type I 3-dehydroquinate dehydratase, partial [Candidatus Thorarchaeota archaeon]
KGMDSLLKQQLNDWEGFAAMSKKLCVCLTEKTSQDCIGFVSTSDADIIEHRMDFMDQIEGLGEIYSATETPIIATCRSKEMGGNFAGREQKRIAYLLEALDNGASFVDIEYEVEHNSLKQISDAVSHYNSKLILSKHYTSFTPELPDLIDLIVKMEDRGADIIKLVVTPESLSDCKRILQVYNREGSKIPLIAFAMGNIGRFTRVSALYLGAPFMYVAQDSGKEAASGQIPLSEMRTILRMLS